MTHTHTHTHTGGKKVIEAEGVELVFEGDEGATVRGSEMGPGRVGVLRAPTAAVGEAFAFVCQVRE